MAPTIIPTTTTATFLPTSPSDIVPQPSESLKCEPQVTYDYNTLLFLLFIISFYMLALFDRWLYLKRQEWKRSILQEKTRTYGSMAITVTPPPTGTQPLLPMHEFYRPLSEDTVPTAPNMKQTNTTTTTTGDIDLLTPPLTIGDSDFECSHLTVPSFTSDGDVKY